MKLRFVGTLPPCGHTLGELRFGNVCIHEEISAKNEDRLSVS